MRRIKVPLPPVDEKKKVLEDVDKDRRFSIDASIVRIMKSRKVLGHQQLVAECVEQLSRMFKPDFKGNSEMSQVHVFRGHFLFRLASESD
ncbi:hypothetical protein IFM89_025367 [Coptis chinensis]|uniref:Cullin neddylation domain-containing protein n=1 Tax=Coptis chinensis TaxID=261450 RepID=A0A835HFD8_9MAGN|nr:hypothetical protein IFM89_025367 [Coptis chinensis]